MIALIEIFDKLKLFFRRLWYAFDNITASCQIRFMWIKGFTLKPNWWLTVRWSCQFLKLQKCVVFHQVQNFIKGYVKGGT